MARPIHLFLKEFGGGEASFQPPMPKPPATEEAEAARAPAPDLVAVRVQEAYQQGVAAGRAQEREAAEAQSAELAVDYDRRLQEARNTFSQALAESLVDELRAGIEAARLAVSAHAVTALMPLLRDKLTRSAIESFVAEVAALLEPTDGMAIEVTSPGALVEPVRMALGEAMAKRGAPPGNVRCVVGDTAEIRVALNETVIETRLADWLSRLEGVLR